MFPTEKIIAVIAIAIHMVLHILHAARCRVVGEKVRREKALDFSGCNSRPGTGSFHPVAIETTAEATKLSELSV
jgi:hypothetical protein